MKKTIGILIVGAMLLNPVNMMAQAPVREAVTRASVLLAQDQAPVKPVKLGISKARRITGAVLLGAGAYYFFSAAVADSVDMLEYRTTWIVMGSALSGAGVIVLTTGRRNSPAPAVTLGRNQVAATWRVAR